MYMAVNKAWQNIGFVFFLGPANGYLLNDSMSKIHFTELNGFIKNVNNISCYFTTEHIFKFIGLQNNH